jgi:phage baseplate assembly protein W
MSEGLSVKLPLFIDPIDGAYALHKDLEDLVQQNMKMIILTSPGERVMYPDFGVGIKRFLFEQNSTNTISSIRNRIVQQIKTYLPYVEIVNLSVGSPSVEGQTGAFVDNSTIVVSINFRVPAANIASNLTLPID